MISIPCVPIQHVKSFANWILNFQETAREKSQKYKEGKSVLERLVDN